MKGFETSNSVSMSMFLSAFDRTLDTGNVSLICTQEHLLSLYNYLPWFDRRISTEKCTSCDKSCFQCFLPEQTYKFG